jgi:hypothetical protein
VGEIRHAAVVGFFWPRRDFDAFNSAKGFWAAASLGAGPASLEPNMMLAIGAVLLPGNGGLWPGVDGVAARSTNGFDAGLAPFGCSPETAH